MKCRKCGLEVSKEEIFCGNCGEKIQLQNSTDVGSDFTYCGNCGAKVASGVKFCPECGASAINVKELTKKKNGSKTIPILIGCIVVIIAVLIAVIVYMLNTFDNSEVNSIQTENVNVVANDKGDDAIETDGIYAPESENIMDNDEYVSDNQSIDDADIQESEVQSYNPPVFSKAEASSMLGMSANGNVYYPSNVLDNDGITCWASDPKEGPNPSITLRADTQQYVSGIKFSNGYFKSEEIYTKNKRITKIRISYEGGFIDYSCEPEQYKIMQNVLFEAPVETNFITIQILDSKTGINGWNDICISTIEVY